MSLYEKFFKFKNENIKIIRTFQKKGFWQALQYWCVRTGTLLLRLVYKEESYLFFEINLAEAEQRKEADQSLNLVNLKSQDIPDEYNDEWYDSRLAKNKLEQDSLLLALQENNRIIFSQWLGINNIHIPTLSLSFKIPATTAYMAYSFTQPEHRGKGIASRSKIHALNYLKDNGFQRVFLLIEPGNKPSIHVNRKAGFREYQLLTCRRILLLFKSHQVRDCVSNRQKLFWSIGKTDQQIWNLFSTIDNEL